MLILLPLLLLISSVLGGPPKCPSGINEGDTFDDRNFYYECHSGYGSAQGCMTKDKEVIAFGDKSVLMSNHNGELALHCWKNETTHSDGSVSALYGMESRFQAKVDEMRCENGKKIGEEFIKNGFVRRCDVSEYGMDNSEIIGCLATDNSTTIPLGHSLKLGRMIEKCNFNGTHYHFGMDLAPEVPCTHNGKQYNHNDKFVIDGKFSYRCVPDENGNAEIKFLNCVMPNLVPVGLGKTQKSQGKAYTCKSETELVVE